MKPQEPIPHNYRMSTLNAIFAGSALVLLLLTGLLVVVDYSKGWKKFQLEFLRMQRERIRQEISEAEKSQNQAEIAQLDQQIRDQEREIAKQRRSLREAQKGLDTWEGRHYAADQDYRFAKATADAMRYDAELAALKKSRGWEDVQKALESQLRHVDELKVKLEEVTGTRDAVKARSDEYYKKIAAAEDRKKEINSSITLLNKQLTSVDNSPQFFILNAPLLDFINPTLKVDQVVVRDMFVDLNYMHMPRVDRCTTCHRAVERPGFESRTEAKRLQEDLELKIANFQFAPDKVAEVRARIDQLKKTQQEKSIRNPYRTHPRLEMFVGSASPHPLQDFGCTSCHRGLDRATEFSRAGHTPTSPKQEKRWERRWDWKSQPYLETPMHPRHAFEASCLKCHSGQVEVPGASTINRGTAMVELYGCWACHKIDNWRFQNLRKPGPDLTGIAEKTSPAWVARWISEPHEFRSTTRMPSFFYQRNMVGPMVDPAEREQNIRKQNAEIQSIVAYLFAKSTRRAWTPGGAGDPSRGQQLVSTVGCMGCHVAQETVTGEDGVVRAARRDDFPLERNYGFNLAGTGTKTHPAWLFNWLKNPKNYYPDAPMPDLRLTDQEASDIASYLMTLQKPQFMNKALPPVDRAVVIELLKSYLATSMTDRDSTAKLQSMPVQDQMVFLGQRSIEKYGCFSCHTIEGFDKAKPIGTELTTEGSKNLHLFDFGFVHEYESEEDHEEEHIIHTVPSWIYHKVRSPRVYDDMREKNYQDKLKMPNFHLSKAEAEALTAVVLGMTKDRVGETRVAAQSPRARSIEAARKAISQHNCRGCHIVNRSGRAIASTIADEGLLPPDLTPEGNRVQSEWLFNFLKDPTVMTMRPWLNVRMPTFHFSDEETSLLVNGFAAEGNVPQFDTTRNFDPSAQNVEIGRTLFEMLRCAQCHPTGAVTSLAGVDMASLAPNLQLARPRLRYEWIPDWIRRPSEMIPTTKMPTNFPRDPESGGFMSPLAAAINSPQFAAYRQRLMRYYTSDQELEAALSDVHGMTNYLRDYIWSLGPREMRSASPETAISPHALPKPPAPAPAVQSTSVPARPAAPTSGD